MRIALISDIHANLVALRAVLRDIERVGVDRIACLGDVATLGPDPEATIQTLRALKCPCIRGNHDVFLMNPGMVASYTDAREVRDAVVWCRAQLSQESLSFLGNFQPDLKIELEAEVSLLLFHGSPRSDTEGILATTPPKTLDHLLRSHQATVMAGGHTHIQMLRQHSGTLFVNPGSVGMPFREPVTGKAPTLLHHAEYATIEVNDGAVTVGLRRVRFDVAALRETIAATDYPLRDILLRQYG